MRILSFVSELKRRRVFRVAAVYAVVGFVLVQVADLLVPALLLPDWTYRFVVLLVLLGFPVALVLAWAFDLTPEGIVRTPPAEGVPPRAGGKLALYGGLGLAALAGAILLVMRPGAGPPGEGGVPWEDGAAIAVLPFLNISPDRDQEYFSDGITEDLIRSLSHIEGLRVTPRTSVMRFKGSDLPIREISRELGVGFVLEGSARLDGRRVRVSAQLIDADGDVHLWADLYDRELTGIFELQSEITEEIARSLEQRLAPTARERIARGGTESLAAYDLLLRGREYLGRPGRADQAKYRFAADFFRRSLEADPGYARAHAGLAERFRRDVGLPVTPVRRDSILFHAGRAAELDPGLAEAVTELGYGHLFGQDWEEAERAFRRALSLDRSQADAMRGLSRLAALQGRLDEAAVWQRRALVVDPLSPEGQYGMGIELFDLGDLDGAEAAFRRAVELAPDYPEALQSLGLVHFVRDEAEAFDDIVERLRALRGDDGAVLSLARLETFRGRYDEAETHFARTPLGEFGAGSHLRGLNAKLGGDRELALELARPTEVMLAAWEAEGLVIPPRGSLYSHILRGEADRALDLVRRQWRTGLRWLEDPPDTGIYWLDRDPTLRLLREAPGFEELMREVRSGLDSMRALVGDEAG